jgi:hypothetical protein
MAFDANRSRVVLFGGDSLQSQLLDDTWEWDGANWVQVADIGPSARAEHAVAYETGRQRVLLFGGSTGGTAVRDTWEWDGESWSQLADTGPAARSGHALAYDTTRSRAVLFGGASADGEPAGDTWEWDGTDWVELQDVGPSARRGHAMAFDEARGRVVLFGGAGNDGGRGRGDTWEWDGTTWTQVADFGPDPCVDLAMAFTGSRITLYGGVGSLSPSDPQPVFGLSWEWNGKQWTVRQDIGPGPRVGHAMAFDAPRRRVVLFGGLPIPPGQPEAAGRLLGDTWERFEEGVTTPMPPVLASLDVQPATVHLGDTLTLTATITSPAPPGGFTVSLTASITVRGIPLDFPIARTLTVPAGALAAVVTTVVQLPPIIDPGDIDPSGADVTVAGTAGGVTKTASFKLLPR